MQGQLSRTLSFWATCQSVAALFINPPDTAAQISDPVYYVGNPLEIKWASDLATVDILLWQSLAGGNFSTILPLSSADAYSWTVTKRDFTTESDTFFLALYEHGATEFAFRTHDFQILSSSTTSTSLGTSATSTFTKSSSPSSSTSLTNSSVPAPSSSGLSSGAIAGIAIGAVLGVIALAGLGWFLLRQRKQPPQTYEAATNSETQHETKGNMHKYAGQTEAMIGYTGQTSPQHQNAAVYELGPGSGTAFNPNQHSELDTGASGLVDPERRSELYGSPRSQ